MSSGKKLDIVIIADFCSAFDGKGNNRFVYLADILSLENDVEILTSDFYHGTKEYFTDIPTDYSYKVSMLHEPAYYKNVCIKRFFSHYVWGMNVKKYLKNRKRPDVIYAAMPTLKAAKEAAIYCKKNKIRFIIDVQDLWPEAYQMIFNPPIINKLIYAPFKWIANGAYKRADEICAVSQTYVERALKVNKEVKEGHSVFLGTNLRDFDANVEANKIENEVSLLLPKKNNLWLAYCGSFGDSYDIETVIDALAIIKEKGKKAPLFVAMGAGYKQKLFELHAKEKGVEVIFTGKLPYAQMCRVLSRCDIAVNPITCGSAASIINKHADYAASGLPVINSQDGDEYRRLIDDYHMGLNCKNGDPFDMADKLIQLIENDNMRIKMGKASRKCAEEKFDRMSNYNTLLQIVRGGY